jgi:hypothetical protein
VRIIRNTRREVLPSTDISKEYVKKAHPIGRRTYAQAGIKFGVIFEQRFEVASNPQSQTQNVKIQDLTVCRGSIATSRLKSGAGKLTVHPASEDPVLRGDFQDRVDRENFLRGRIANSQAVPPREPIEPRNRS